MKALIHKNKIVQVQETTFPVAPELTWYDVPENCTTEWTWDGTQAAAPPGPNLEDAKAKKILAINALREQKIYSDIAYEFPDGPGVIQLRNNQDVRNIQSLVSGAQMQIIAGNPDAPMVFRDADDNTRQLTATQIAQMGAYVLDRGQAVYTASWELKDQVNAASSFEELEAINIDEEMVITT
jgi:hypothetical protein